MNAEYAIYVSVAVTGVMKPKGETTRINEIRPLAIDCDILSWI